MPLRRIVVDPKKVLSGYTIASVTGTIPNMTDLEVEGINVSSIDTVAKITPPQGYYDSSSRIKITDADFISENIKSDVNVFGLLGRGSLGNIKTIQNINFTGISYTLTTPVNINNSILIYNGHHTSSSNLSLSPLLTLTSTKVNSSVNTGGSISATIIEFEGGIKSKQSGIITIAPGNAIKSFNLVTSVIPAKSILTYTGMGTSSSHDANHLLSCVSINTLGTTITATRNYSGCADSVDVGWNLIEFN